MADDLIHEVEEAVRQEKIEQLWKEYGSYIIAAVILTVLVTALVSGWRSWDSKMNTANTTAMIEALDNDDKAGSLEKEIAGLRPNHKALSHLTAAGLLLREDDKQGALEHYREAAKNKDIAPVFRDLSQVLAVRLEWSMAEAERENGPQELLAMLKPVWSNDKSPWRYHAHMQAALISAHALGDYQGARGHLETVIRAQDVPASMIDRARSLDHVYALKTAEARGGQDAAEEPEG